MVSPVLQMADSHVARWVCLFGYACVDITPTFADLRLFVEGAFITLVVVVVFLHLWELEKRCSDNSSESSS